MSRIKLADWRPVGIDELEPGAWDALRHAGSSCVVAGPGAGKTEFLAQRADYLLTTGLCPQPQSILAISFKRDAARNLAKRVDSRTPSSANRFDSMTFDAFTKGLVDRFRAALPDQWRIASNYEIWFPNQHAVNAHLQDLGVKYPEHSLAIAGLSRENFVTETVGVYPLPQTRTTVRTVEEFAVLRWWDRYFLSVDLQRVDFVMLNRLAELIVRANPAIHRALLATYPYVFIDEFQDTTFAQYSFLRTVFGTGRTVVTAVGDEKQRIMGWAGALDSAFNEYQSDFGADRFPLTWNFRSSEAMTSLHDVVAVTLDAEVVPAVSKVSVNVEGNPAEIWQFSSAQDEARFVAEWINDDARASGRSPDRYALLARQKTVDLQPLLEAELARFGILLRNDDGLVGSLRLQDLLADELALLVLDIIRLAATDGGNGEAWIRASSVVARMHDRSRQEDVASASDRAFEVYIGRLRRWMRRNGPGRKAVELVVDETIQFLGVGAIQSTFLVHAKQSFLNSTISALKARLHEVGDSNTNWDTLCDRAEGKGAVPLQTIHKSKGLEYHTVIFLSLDDRQWWPFEKDPGEGLRTFFVGLSRAEQRMIFTYCSSRGRRMKIEALYGLLSEGDVAEVWPSSQ